MDTDILKIGRFFAGALVVAAGLSLAAPGSRAQTVTNTNSPAWITHPLSLVDCLNSALERNGTILKARSDLEASHGLVVQTRAIALPKIQTTSTRGPSSFTSEDPNLIETIPGVPASFPHENWNSAIQIVQSVYEGGRISARAHGAAHEGTGAAPIPDGGRRHAACHSRGILRRAASPRSRSSCTRRPSNCSAGNSRISNTVTTPAPCRVSTCCARKSPWRMSARP